LALTLSEREEISRGLVAGHSLRTIGEQLGRSPSTISREVRRNRGRRGYRAVQADRLAWERARRPKRCKLAENRVLARIVASKLQQLWSPEQIAGWLKRTYPDDENYQVSHETIYRSLFIDNVEPLRRFYQIREKLWELEDLRNGGFGCRIRIRPRGRLC
jgi:IS30 family transposase